MKKIIFSILLVFLITDSFSQCVNADSLYTNNITCMKSEMNLIIYYMRLDKTGTIILILVKISIT